jgi:anti-repressor protein
MNELIKINEKGLVNGRELHEFLENKRQFADWMKQRISQYGFIENEDFTIHKFVNGKATQIDYALTIDTAKELSMVENNEKGREARKYFIQCEKAFKSQLPKLSKELQAIFVLDEKTAHLEEEIKDIKENTPLYNIECEELQKAVRKKGVQVLGGKNAAAYKNKSIRTKVYSDIQHEIKREFDLNSSYKAIKRKEYEKALEIIESYEVPYSLGNEISDTNNQMQFA